MIGLGEGQFWLVNWMKVSVETQRQQKLYSKVYRILVTFICYNSTEKPIWLQGLELTLASSTEANWFLSGPLRLISAWSLST